MYVHHVNLHRNLQGCAKFCPSQSGNLSHSGNSLLAGFPRNGKQILDIQGGHSIKYCRMWVCTADRLRLFTYTWTVSYGQERVVFWKITLQALNTQSEIKLERTSVLLLAKYPFQYINISQFSNFLPEHDDLDLAKRFKSPPLPRKKTGISLVISFFNDGCGKMRERPQRQLWWGEQGTR